MPRRPTITSPPNWTPPLEASRPFSAVLFDLDGVLTPTTAAHQAAWALMFDEFFGALGVLPAFAPEDYFAHVDGRPRYEAVADVLASRGLALPWGDPQDAAGTGTVCALGNAKDSLFEAVLARDGVKPYPASEQLARRLHEAGVATAVVSSSHAARNVLAVAGIDGLFDVVMDGHTAREQALPGKPAPDTYLHVAATLGVAPADAVVIEDALSGVAAAAAGGFGLIIGVDRGAGARALLDAGAHVVVADLSELLS